MARPAGAVLVLAPGPREGADRTGGRSVLFLQERLVPAPRVTYVNASTHHCGSDQDRRRSGLSEPAQGSRSGLSRSIQGHSVRPVLIQSPG